MALDPKLRERKMRGLETGHPVLAATDLEVQELDRGRARVRMPVETNANHIGTFYAGSLFVLFPCIPWFPKSWMEFWTKFWTKFACGHATRQMDFTTFACIHTATLLSGICSVTTAPAPMTQCSPTPAPSTTITRAEIQLFAPMTTSPFESVPN